MTRGAWAILLLAPAAVLAVRGPCRAAPRAGDDSASGDLSAKPSWMGEDQLIECATVLADGLRAFEQVLNQGGPLLLAAPALENRTDLPIPEPEALIRTLTRLTALRSGCRVGFADARAGAQAGRFSDPPPGGRTRLVVAPAERDDEVLVALYAESPASRVERCVAEYVLEPQVRPGGRSDKRPPESPLAAASEEYARRLPINEGEIRFETRKLAERLRLLADHTIRLSDGRISVRVHLIAPHRDVKAKVRVAFLAEDGRLIHTTEERKNRFEEGRLQVLRADSPRPATSAVVYLDD